MHIWAILGGNRLSQLRLTCFRAIVTLPWHCGCVVDISQELLQKNASLFQNSVVFCEKQLLHSKLCNKPSTFRVSGEGTLNSQNGKDEGTRPLRRQVQACECTCFKAVWTSGCVTHALWGFESEAQLQLLKAHTQAGHHRRDASEMAELQVADVG